MDHKDRKMRAQLKNNMLRLNKHQFKLFYTMLVHYWVRYKFFISKQGFFNLWCELNELCHDTEEGFPEPHDDHKLMLSYCVEHPYYFIDILNRELVINLFCEHLEDKIDILARMVKMLGTGGLRAAYAYSNKALELTENIEDMILETEQYVRTYS